MARAIYSRKSILILDDISSALDKATSTAIHDKLFGDGGSVRETDATVIIATNSCKLQLSSQRTTYLRSLIKTVDNLAIADQLLTLDSTGRISNTTLAKSDSLAREQKLGKASHEKSFQGSAVNASAYGTKPAAAAANNFCPMQTQTLYRQNGDASIYYFYIKANGLVLFIVWLFIVALSAVWQKMPCKCNSI